jgi:hypothetical protein
MLHPVYRLATDAQQRMRLGPVVGRAWRPTVVVPREVCVFEQVPAAGVAWHERTGFARLQALRLAPFTNTGGNAAVRGRTLMMWFWDAQEVQTALTDGGLDPARVLPVAEPLMLALPNTSGAAAVRCQGGTDHVVLDAGAILSSRWQADDTRGRAPPDLLRRPWARDLLQPGGALGAWDAVRLQRVLTMACWAVAFGFAAYLAYWGGQWQALEARIAAQEGRATDDSTDFGRLLQLKQAQSADRAWLDAYQRLSGSIRIEPMLTALQRPLEANNLTMKELELRNEDLRIVVSSAGGEIDLPRVLQALSALPGFESVQLRQSADTQQAAFTMRVGGYRSEPAGAP